MVSSISRPNGWSLMRILLGHFCGFRDTGIRDRFRRKQLQVAVMPSRLTHVPALDGLRGVAILSVMFFHVTLHAGPRPVGGFLGVDIFWLNSVRQNGPSTATGKRALPGRQTTQQCLGIF